VVNPIGVHPQWGICPYLGRFTMTYGWRDALSAQLHMSFATLFILFYKVQLTSGALKMLATRSPVPLCCLGYLTLIRHGGNVGAHVDVRSPRMSATSASRGTQHFLHFSHDLLSGSLSLTTSEQIAFPFHAE
jgi:hypothetical protein